jgi:hypothetical protein
VRSLAGIEGFSLSLIGVECADPAGPLGFLPTVSSE